MKILLSTTYTNELMLLASLVRYAMLWYGLVLFRLIIILLE